MILSHFAATELKTLLRELISEAHLARKALRWGLQRRWGRVGPGA